MRDRVAPVVLRGTPWATRSTIPFCADDTGVAKTESEFFAHNKGRQAAFGYKQSIILHVAPEPVPRYRDRSKLGYKVC